MKIQLDTTEKTIKLENDVLLGDFFERITTILPGDSWKEFKLLTETKIEWASPIIIEKTHPWIYPSIPYEPYPYRPWITWCGDSVGDTKPAYIYNSGVYNIELS